MSGDGLEFDRSTEVPLMVNITKDEYENLKAQSVWLFCLRAKNVDEWDKYDEAMELFFDIRNKEKED